MAMFGAPPVEAHGDLSPMQKTELLLDEHPEARGDDKLLMLLWWERFDALPSLFFWTLRDLFKGEMDDEELQVMADAALEQFKDWFRSTATHPETIRRRRAELQSNRKEHGVLRGSPQVTAYRRARDGAGPPRR